jgi:uncharacterized protein YqjF (DUF2071 family)
MQLDAIRLAASGALAASRVGLSADELIRMLEGAGVVRAHAERALRELSAAGLARAAGERWELTTNGIAALLEAQASLEAALGQPSDGESCPSIPWLTAVRTCWVEALSLNYAVEPEALAPLLPAPLEPEPFKERAWLQVLMSSLRDLRPQGVPSLFGVCFYQASYRIAVRYRAASGEWRRGGYFVRSETNHPVMRAIGNALNEFRFHDFGAADMVMVSDGARLTVGIDPEPTRPGGRLVGMFDLAPLPGPPPGSLWKSLDELHEPLVECYDAFGVDREAGFLYVLTIDRDPWNARFVRAEDLYCELAESSPLAGRCRLDSVLHLRECGYRWRPLRREPLASRRR